MDEVGPVAQGFLDELGGIAGGCRRERFVDEVIIRRIAFAEKIDETGECGFEVVGGLGLQKHGFLEIYAGEADVEGGLEFVLGELVDLLEGELPGGDSLRGDTEEGLRLQGAEVSGVEREENLSACGQGILFLSLLLGFGTRGQVVGAAEVGDELRDCDAFRVALEDEGIVKAAGGDAGVGGGGADSGCVSGDRGIIGRASFTDDLMRRERDQFSSRDAGVIFDGEFAGLREGQDG